MIGCLAAAGAFAFALLAPQSASAQPAARPTTGAAAARPGAELARFDQHHGPVRAVAVSQNGKYIATAGEDRICYVLDAASLKLVRQYGPLGRPLTGVVWMRDKTVVVSSLFDKDLKGSVFFYKWDTGQLSRVLYDSQHDSFGVCISPNEELLAVALGNPHARYWRLAANQRFGLEGPRPDRLCLCVGFSSDGKRLVTGSGSGLSRWYVGTERRGGAASIDGETAAVANSVEYSRADDVLAAGYADGVVRLWREVGGGVKVQRMVGHAGEVNDVAFSPDGKEVASASADKSIRVWNAADGKLRGTLTGHKEAVTCVAFVPDANVLVSGSADGTVRLWRLGSAAKIPSEPANVASDLPNRTSRTPRGESKPKAARPSEAQFKQANALVREVFQEEYDSAKRPADKVKLARKVLEQAQTESADAVRYALLLLAQRLAVDAGSVATALEATMEISDSYQMDRWKLHLDTLEKLSAKAISQRGELAEAALKLAEEALTQDAFDVAAQFNKHAATAATRGTRLTAVARRNKDLEARIAQMREEFAAFSKAQVTLKSRPTDTAAHGVIGKYLCFVKQKWPEGLSHLAQGDDALLKATAAADIAAPSEPTDQAALGDRWMQVGESQPAEHHQACLASAQLWYRRALPGLSGLQSLRVKKALDKLADLSPSVRREAQ